MEPPNPDAVLLLDRDESSDLESDLDVTIEGAPRGRAVEVEEVPEGDEPIEIDPAAHAALKDDNHSGYTPLQGVHSERQIHLPEGFYEQPELHKAGAEPAEPSELRWDLPLLYFKLFFTEWVFEVLARNTNAYAASKDAGNGGRRWKPVTTAEMKIWIGLIIYMSVFKQPRTTEYWLRRDGWPIHPISRFIGQSRFEQIKRYFHIAPPGVVGSIFDKLEPVASYLREAFKRVVTPATAVAIDEMIVRFKGRSVHTVMMRGKPVPQGYYVLALCEGGYCWSWLFTSSRVSDEEIVERITSLHLGPEAALRRLLPRLSKKVLYLLLQLPFASTFYTLYCDNLFSNPDLFHVLRAFGIAACGTARSTCRGWPTTFKQAIARKTTRLPYNQQYTTVVHGDVAAIVWQDKNLVQFLTTAHDPQSRAFISRRRPQARTTWLKRVVSEHWGPLGSKVMLHPQYSVDYNSYMNAVDVHDQLRSYYNTQLKAFRIWMPLFFFMLDAAVINAFLIAKQQHQPLKDAFITQQRAFRLRLAWCLTLQGSHGIDQNWTSRLSNTARSAGGQFMKGNRTNRRHTGGFNYITKKTSLPTIRHAPGNHILVRNYQQRRERDCAPCRFLKQRDSSHKVHRTRLYCIICTDYYPICRHCDQDWHTTQGTSLHSPPA